MKYFGYYAKDASVKRNNPMAAVTKMDYIAKTLSELEYTEIVSASGVVGNKSDTAHVQRINDSLSVHYFYSIGRKNPFLGKISTLFLHFQILWYLLTRIKRNETIIVYHSLGYMRIMQIAKIIKKFRLILEVEEIYADVIGDEAICKKEHTFFRYADAYIFPSKMLSSKINMDNKPEVTIHGTYQVEPRMDCKNDSGKMHIAEKGTIHCVYAGTFDPRKGGAAAAAAAAAFLPLGYHIHILGFGTENEKRKMQELIDCIAKKTKAKVTYDGLLTGNDYVRFIQSCDIGLSTQNPDAAFNASSFPSKILSYMANGLRVVSIRIPAIEQSAVGDMLYYYDKQTPEEIAKAILSVNTHDEYDSRKTIRELDKKFQKSLRELIGY